MVLNAGGIRQNGQKEKCVGREIVAKCPLNGSCFRSKGVMFVSVFVKY